MAKLNAKERNALDSSDFALPAQRKYPIEDRSHAENALSRAAQHPGVEAQVRRAVHAKYPDLGD